MRSNQIPTWAWFLIFFIGLQIFQRAAAPLLYPLLKHWEVPLYLHVLVMLVISNIALVEIFLKFRFLQIMQPPRFSLSQLSDWPKLNAGAFTYYNRELEILGFTPLGDYSAPTVKGMIRLFVHPEHYCMAEVGQLENHPIQCLMVSWLEDDWTLAIANTLTTPKQRSVWYAFHRLPRNLGTRIKDAAPDHLLQSLLDWRAQVSKDLQVSPQQHLSAEIYFAKQRENFQKYRRRLWYSSITWRIIEMYLYRLNPRTEWLGDYPKFKARFSAMTD